MDFNGDREFGICSVCIRNFNRNQVVRIGQRPSSDNQIYPEDGVFGIYSNIPTIDLTGDEILPDEVPTLTNALNTSDNQTPINVVVVSMSYDRTLLHQPHNLSDIRSITDALDSNGTLVSARVATDTMRAYNLETSYDTVVLTTISNSPGPCDIRADVNNRNFLRRLSEELSFVQELYIDDLGQGNPVFVDRYTDTFFFNLIGLYNYGIIKESRPGARDCFISLPFNKHFFHKIHEHCLDQMYDINYMRADELERESHKLHWANVMVEPSDLTEYFNLTTDTMYQYVTHTNRGFISGIDRACISS